MKRVKVQQFIGDARAGSHLLRRQVHCVHDVQQAIIQRRPCMPSYMSDLPAGDLQALESSCAHNQLGQ